MPRRETLRSVALTLPLAGRARRGVAARRAAVAPAPVPRPARPDRAALATLDQANYSCGCGFVFRAAVLTSVSCPHCGRGQAW